MDNFKKKLFGYSMSQVERYFADLENQHQTSLGQKESELNLIKEKISQLTSENNKLAQELDELNKERDNLINYVNKRVDEIEQLVNDKQGKSQEIKQAAIKKLTLKRDELIKVQSCIEELKKDLHYIKYRQNQARELLNR